MCCRNRWRGQQWFPAWKRSQWFKDKNQPWLRDLVCPPPLTLEIGPLGYAAAVWHLDTDFRAACRRKSSHTKRILWVSADANCTPQPPVDREVAASWKYSCRVCIKCVMIKRTMVLINSCHHLILRSMCAAHTVRLCPICRVGTDSLLKIYRS